MPPSMTPPNTNTNTNTNRKKKMKQSGADVNIEYTHLLARGNYPPTPASTATEENRTPPRSPPPQHKS